jgi:hypothetical protein
LLVSLPCKKCSLAGNVEHFHIEDFKSLV